MGCLALSLGLVLTVVAPAPPPPTHWVTDTAGFLTPAAQQRLDARLAAYERATGHQVVVWIGKTLGDTPLDEWATRTFEGWRLGRKGQDDGVALFVLADDRHVAIEVGYGLEAVIPDAVAARIIREQMAPRLRAGDRDGAVTAAVDSLLGAAGGEAAGARALAPPPPPLRKHNRGGVVLLVFMLAAILLLAMRSPMMAAYLLLNVLGGRRGGGWGGGDAGGGGGDFPTFGGGGGRSGGGGARGGW